jgi:hypothetical protein
MEAQHVDLEVPLSAPLSASGAPSSASGAPSSASGAPSAAGTVSVTEEQKYQYQHDDDDDDKDGAPVHLAVNTNLPLKTKKSLNSTNATENWRMILMARNQFIKHGRYGKPKARKIVVNCNTGDVSWNGEYKGLNVKNFVGVTFGKEARPLQRDWAFMVEASLCFTLHFISRDVCLQSGTVHQAESFVEALTAFSEYLKTTKRASSKYKSGLKQSASTTDTSKPTAAPAGVGSTGTLSRRGKAVMDTLPDRAMSKHMQSVRKAKSQKTIR